MFYKYKVNITNSYSYEEEMDEGIVVADSYADAADEILDSYGKDYLIDMYLYEIYTEGDSHCLNKEDIEYAFKE